MVIKKVWFSNTNPNDPWRAYEQLENWSKDKFGKVISIETIVENDTTSYLVWYWG